MTTIDLTPIVQAVVMGAAAILTWALSLLLFKMKEKFHLDISDQEMKNYDAILEKGIHAGAMAFTEEIKEKGWDHPEIRDGIVSFAVDYIKNKFAGTVAKVGLNLENIVDQNHLSDALLRAFPSAISEVVYSPVTPAAPESVGDLLAQGVKGIEEKIENAI